MPELSHNDIRQLLEQALNEGQSADKLYMRWIRDVFPTYFVYQDEGAKMYRRTYVIGPDKTVTLGEREEVVEVRSYEPVVTTAAYSLTGAVTFSDDGFVEREGVIFECGEYADKQFSMTPEELKVAADKFEPVDLELEHFDTEGRPNLLSGKLGTLATVRLSEDGKQLLGKTRLPEWLHNLYKDVPIAVSAVWHRAEKTLDRAGLVLNPRVPTAAVFSAYAQFAGKRHSDADLRDLQAIHDLVVGQGAECKAAMSSHKKEKRMGLLEDIKALFTKHNIPVEDEGAPQSAQPTQPTQPTQPPVAPQPDPEQAVRFSSMQAEIDRLNNERRQAAAKAAVDEWQRQGKITPAGYLVAFNTYLRALEDDERDPQFVTFTSADNKEVKASRVDLVKAQYDTRPAHGLFGGGDIPSVAFALPTSGSGEQKTDFEQGKEVGAGFVDRNFPSQNGHKKD